MTKQGDYFKRFCGILSSLNTAQTTDEILSQIVDSAIEEMDGKAACLYLDRHKGVFEPVARKGLSENYLHANAVKAKKSIKELRYGEYLYFKDATTDERLENHDTKKAEGIASILTVPVRLSDITIGALTLYTGTIREFSPREIEFLTALAEQGAFVIQRSRLIDRMRKNATLFLKLSTAINSSLDIRDILETLTVSVCESFGMTSAVIRLLDKDTNSLRVVASHGLSQEFLELGNTVDTPPAGKAIKGETVCISDISTSDEVRFKDAFAKEGLVSMISTPIISKDEVIGVLRMFSDKKRHFQDEFISVVEAIGHQGGVAIQNSSMYLQLQESKKILEQEIWSHRSWF